MQNKLNKENQVDKTNSNPFDVTKGEVQNAVNDENINNVESNGLINDELKPEVQLEAKPIVQPEIKPEVKPELKPEVQPEVQMEAKPIVQPEVKLENTEKVQEEQSIEKEPIQNNLKNDVQAPIVEELLPIDNAVNGLNNIVQELNKKMTLNQSEEIIEKPIKNVISFDDEEKEGDELINNDINIQENKEIQPQLSANMSFNSDGQPFSSFMENEKDEKKSQSILGNSAKDLAEEAAILSTMAENIAIANKNKGNHIIRRSLYAKEKNRLKKSYQR